MKQGSATVGVKSNTHAVLVALKVQFKFASQSILFLLIVLCKMIQAEPDTYHLDCVVIEVIPFSSEYDHKPFS